MRSSNRWRKAPRRSSGRGVAYWSDGRGDARILTVTPGFHLVALDAGSGRPVPGFGEGGVVDLMRGLRGDVDPVGAIGNSSPPGVFEDLVIVGPALEVGLRPRSKRNVKGDVRALDVRTGAQRWVFHTVPEPGAPGSESWEDPASLEYTGNAGVWAPFSVDTALGRVYLPVEGLRPNTDKVLRITKIQPQIKNGVIRFRRHQTILLDQLRYFPKAEHDDGPDALEMTFTLITQAHHAGPRVRLL